VIHDQLYLIRVRRARAMDEDAIRVELVETIQFIRQIHDGISVLLCSCNVNIKTPSFEKHAVEFLKIVKIISGVRQIVVFVFLKEKLPIASVSHASVTFVVGECHRYADVAKTLDEQIALVHEQYHWRILEELTIADQREQSDRFQ